jgi:hypothetical protein
LGIYRVHDRVGIGGLIGPQAGAGEIKRVAKCRRTGWQRSLELVGLLGVLEDKGVQVALAADLELDLGGLLAALYSGSCDIILSAFPFFWIFCWRAKFSISSSRFGDRNGGTYMKHPCVCRSQ